MEDMTYAICTDGDLRDTHGNPVPPMPQYQCNFSVLRWLFCGMDSYVPSAPVKDEQQVKELWYQSDYIDECPALSKEDHAPLLIAAKLAPIVASSPHERKKKPSAEKHGETSPTSVYAPSLLVPSRKRLPPRIYVSASRVYWIRTHVPALSRCSSRRHAPLSGHSESARTPHLPHRIITRSRRPAWRSEWTLTRTRRR